MILLELIKDIQKEDEYFDLEFLVTDEKVRKVIETDAFTNVERTVYWLRYEQDLGFAEIASHLSITRQRVFTICKKLPRKINQKLRLSYKSKRESPLTEIEDLDLSTKAYGALHRIGVKKIEQIYKLYQDGELKSVKGLGAKCYKEICNKLIELGYDMTKNKFKIKMKNIIEKNQLSKEDLISYIEENL